MTSTQIYNIYYFGNLFLMDISVFSNIRELSLWWHVSPNWWTWSMV